jgi:hypothetical protein
MTGMIECVSSPAKRVIAASREAENNMGQPGPLQAESSVGSGLMQSYSASR